MADVYKFRVNLCDFEDIIWRDIEITPVCGSFAICDAIYMKTAQDDFVPWLASQTDVLAIDWLLVE